MQDLETYTKAHIDLKEIKRVFERLKIASIQTNLKEDKKTYLVELEKLRKQNVFTNEMLCDIISEEIYLHKILPLKNELPMKLKNVL